MAILDWFVPKGYFRPSPRARQVLGIETRTVAKSGLDEEGRSFFLPAIKTWLKSRAPNLDGLKDLRNTIDEFVQQGMDIHSLAVSDGLGSLLEMASCVDKNTDRHCALVKVLVELGADLVRPVDPTWLYPECRMLGIPSGALWNALNSGNVEMVELLLSLGTPVAPFDTPQGLACLEGISHNHPVMQETIGRYVTGQVAMALSQTFDEATLPSRTRRL
jgi:hypothetical protein